LLVGDASDLLSRIAKDAASPRPDLDKSFTKKLLSRFPKILFPIYHFPGQTSQVVLVVAGIHPSEPSGTEVACWLRELLESDETGVKPYYTTILIPQVFKHEGDMGRNAAKPSVKPTEIIPFRDIIKFGQHNMPNRLFPRPGTPVEFILSHGSLKDGYFALGDGLKLERFQTSWKESKNGPTLHGTSKMLDEILVLSILVEIITPVRIVSIHAKRLDTDKPAINHALQLVTKSKRPIDFSALEESLVGLNCPGIFVDPRYKYSREGVRNLDAQKFSLEKEPSYKSKNPNTFSSTNRKEGIEDDDLCLQTATQVSLPIEHSGDSKIWSKYTPLLVIGNRLHLSPTAIRKDLMPTVHYALEGSFPGFQGYSLGDWGPVTVEFGGAGNFGVSGERPGAPVYTIETFGCPHSSSFESCESRPRSGPDVDSVRGDQLRQYARGIKAVLLEAYKPSEYRTRQESQLTGP